MCRHNDAFDDKVNRDPNNSLVVGIVVVVAVVVVVIMMTMVVMVMGLAVVLLVEYTNSPSKPLNKTRMVQWPRVIGNEVEER